jgi:hypothetical protein
MPDEIIAPDPPGWLQRRYPNITRDFQWQIINPETKEPIWTSSKGPQTWMLLCPYDEILVGGRRGGGKSQGLIAWFAMGDLTLDDDDPAKATYLNDPYFRGLILRKESSANVEFIDECRDFYRNFKCKPVDDPVRFEFNTDKTGRPGAIIYTNHLNTPEAYEKYRGWGITKIGIEELVQIEKEDAYLRLLGSLRGKKMTRVINGRPRALLKCQILSTTNPDGPGGPWVKRRFIKCYAGGNLIPWNNPMRNPISGLMRIFIPMLRKDNPFLANNRQYESMLLEQSPLKQKQWMEGDWEAAASTYFLDFRPNGPIGDKEAADTPWARHVI